MCGITGCWAYNDRDVGWHAFLAFTNSLAHRGPDGSGVQHFVADRLWFGHRRLSIIDVSERGRQPMSYADGRYWLTYNGEIYNFIELREDLKRLGHAFVSDSDSEVILAAYAQWGDQCQARFNGMWAFAIWDDHDKRLFLSRDRFAVKPVYYADVNGSFSFASELKSFLHWEWCDGSFDERVLLETLHHPSGQEAGPETVLPSVKRLLGGHCLMLDSKGLRVWQWWDTMAHLCGVPKSLPAQAEQFRELFLDACRLRLRSDVSIATSLSGGLDSSAVACSIAELRRRQTVDHVPQDWQRAFVACFPGTPLDEQRYAEQVVSRAGMHPHYYAVDEREVIRDIETIIYDLETIFNNPLVGAWAIYREMRRSGIPVSLDGHGSDELIGGYHYFVDAAIDEMCGLNFRLGR
jgi:asparagine synthase (glutamine-hydrolysing)